jgi:hypothetical protein
MEVTIIIRRTIIPLTMATVVLIGGVRGTSKRLFPLLFLLLSLLFYTQIQLYIRKTHYIIITSTRTCFARVHVHMRRVQTVPCIIPIHVY